MFTLWLVSRAFGAAAALGALTLAGPASTASACPEHDKGADAGSSSNSAGASNANASAGGDSADPADSTNKAGATGKSAAAQPARNTSKKADSDPPCSGGAAATESCNPAVN